MKQTHSKNAGIQAPLISQLDSREAALWITDPQEDSDFRKLALLCRLPWNVVLSECSDEQLLSQLEAKEDLNDVLIRRRGLVHVIDTDPAQSHLPPRHLAVMLLNGRGNQRRAGLSAITRRLTMLQELRARSIRQLVVAVPGAFAVPEDLGDMWSDGFRTAITFVSDDPAADQLVDAWRTQYSAQFVQHIELSPAEFSDKLQADYLRGRDGATVCKVRDERGNYHVFDATGIDDPGRPILGSYEMIGSEVLSPLLPSDLTADEVNSFFADSRATWRPYAAGIVWERDESDWKGVRARLRLLDKQSTVENKILYVTAEPGAGVTTFLRDLAWRAAAEGYPTLLARPGTIPTSSVELASFLTRLVNAVRQHSEEERLYEVPCLLVFDESHWEGRYTELTSFARELEKSGRRVCILVAAGNYIGHGIQGERRYQKLADLSNSIPFRKTLAIGEHLNRFLAPHGTNRTEREWKDFYEATSTGSTNNVASFWIVLSFWLQRQIDLGETVQSRLYKQFKEKAKTETLKIALLRIAAFSTVKTPLPDELLPETNDWPITEKLEDMRREIGLLGLIKIRTDSDRSWVMAHNILGRYLIAALYEDSATKKLLGYDEAQNTEHLRFLILKQISMLPALSKTALRPVADAFAVSIFKIDPLHGYASLSLYWRDALQALDAMPQIVRTTSRTFLHHSAISRRRITAGQITFPMSVDERVSIVRNAVEDLELALRLDASPGSETDLNLYNSLALALHDLADAEEAAGADPVVVAQTKTKAQEVTRRAYSSNPESPFVIETYARTLISEGRANNILAAEKALEVLTIAYSMMERSGFETRRNALSRLAEAAFHMLLDSGGAAKADPSSEVGAIAIALSRLGAGSDRNHELQLNSLPAENRVAAAELLSAPPLLGNLQAVKLRYMLAVLDRSLDFDLQLELLQSLQGSGPAFTPQMELELAVLLFQKGRADDGAKIFQKLRGIWRRGEYFVEVPTRLHWLLDESHKSRKQVRARVSSNAEDRGFAKVSEFRNVEVPFRALEFGQERHRPGAVLDGYITFNHNGPLLRPLTAARR